MDKADQKILADLQQAQPHERECKYCHKSWKIGEDDLEFFRKLIVPVPQTCPQCSLQRKIAWRNERNLYKRKCDGTGEEIISIYSPDKPYKVYDKDYWHSDSWDAMEYGQEYDPNRSFFDQFRELLLRVPLMSLMWSNNVNSDYLNHGSGNKNCYLIAIATNNEDCYYGRYITDCRECVDCMEIEKSEGCYGNVLGVSNYKCNYAYICQNCAECHFSVKLNNCKNCILCSNLQNEQYMIRNERVTKEKYEKFVAEMDFDEIRKEFLEMKDVVEVRYAYWGGSEDWSGNFVMKSKNCKECFMVTGAQDCKYLYDVPNGVTDCYDCHTIGLDTSLAYNSLGSIRDYQLKCDFLVLDCKYLEYSHLCFNCDNLYGCVGLKHKKYCVLNKQYSKEEYEKLVEQIKLDMLERGEYGEFFPSQILPFGYNETLANEYTPLTKEEAIAQGFKWSDYDPEGKYDGSWYEPDADVSVYADEMKANELLAGVLKCEVSGKPFRIIGPELGFYIKYGIPVPRRSPDQRHIDRMSYKNPYRLWKRQCMCELGGHDHGADRCSREFETTYSPDRKEKVFCGECYHETFGN